MNVAKFLVRDYELQTNTRLTDLRRHINGFIGGGDAQSKPAGAHKNRALATLTKLKIMCASTDPDHQQAAATMRRHLGLQTLLPCEGDRSTSWEAVEAELMASDLQVRAPTTTDVPDTFDIPDPDNGGDPALVNDLSSAITENIGSLDVEDRRKKIQVLGFALKLYLLGLAMKRDQVQRDVGFAALWGSVKTYLSERVQAQVEAHMYAASIVLHSVKRALRNLQRA